MPNDFPSRPSNPRNAVVIGGGVVGLAIAIALQKRDISVILIDSPPPSPAASWGNAGHIAIEQVEPLALRFTADDAAAMATDEVCTVPRPRTKTERQCCEDQPRHNMGDATGPLARPIFAVVALESRLARPPMMGCQVPLR